MDRYRPIIDDWAAFQDCCGRPPRTTVRRNPLKAGDGFADRLRDRFDTVEQAGWHPDIYRLGREETPGRSLQHWRGAYYVQEESAALPVTVLAPKPGERVLDMCAAPGGKTTQMAARIGNDGTIVATEARGSRMRSLHANVNRTGSACVVTSQRDGRHVPDDDYDRVLVDAPCSGEGNECRTGGAPASADERTQLQALQVGLLSQAARVVRDGGRVVYSTCTFAPEENEAVVQRVLEETDMTLLDCDPPVPHRRGVTGWEDEMFDDALRRTVRIYPHHLDSGGMYVAVFEG